MRYGHGVCNAHAQPPSATPTHSDIYHTCTCTYTYTHTDITVLQGYVLQQESKVLPVLSSKLEANDNLSDYFHPNCCKLSVYLWYSWSKAIHLELFLVT